MLLTRAYCALSELLSNNNSMYGRKLSSKNHLLRQYPTMNSVRELLLDEDEGGELPKP